MIIEQKDQKKPLSHYIVKAEVLKRIFDVSGQAISLLNSYFIISSLSVYYFGFYQLVLAFIALLRSVSMQLFDGLVTVEMRRYFNTQKLAFAKRIFLENVVTRLALAVVMAAGVFFGADIIAGFYGKDVAIFIKIASALLILRALQSLFSIFLQSVISFADQSLGFIREFIKLILIISFILLHQFGILEVIIAHVVAEGATMLFFAVFIFAKKYQQAFRNIKSHRGNLMLDIIKTHGLRVFLIYGLKGVLRNIMPWIVNFYLNVEAVAFYAIALNLATFVQGFLPFAGIKPILILKSDNLKELGVIFQRGLKYTLWIGIIYFIVAFFAVPPVLAFIFPKYVSAIPVFLLMIAVLPIYGAVRLINTTLGVLREYGVLAQRVINEILIIVIGSMIFLPIFGLTGVGLVYVAMRLERIWFLYGQLIKRYPIFKMKLKNLVKFDALDKEFAIKSFRQLLGFIRPVMRFIFPIKN